MVGRFDPRRRGLPSSLAFAAVLCGAAAPVGAAERGSQQDCRFIAAETGTIAEIVDGDAIRLTSGAIVRLAAIEVPKPLGTMPAGESWSGAASRLLDQLARGKNVAIAPAGSDRYGRLHADMRLADGRSLAGELVAAGLARVRPLAGENGCVERLLGQEAAARRAARGIWAGPDFAVRAADDPSLLQRSSLYEIVEGRVLSIGHGSRLVFIDFGWDFRRDFTVLVSPELARRFAESGWPVDRLKGRLVRVRGLIEESGGPAIRLNDPIELELVDEDDVGGDGE